MISAFKETFNLMRKKTTKINAIHSFKQYKRSVYNGDTEKELIFSI